MGSLETNIHKDVPLMVQENKGKWNRWGEERLYSAYRFVRAGKDVLGFLGSAPGSTAMALAGNWSPVQKKQSGHGSSLLNFKQALDYVHSGK